MQFDLVSSVPLANLCRYENAHEISKSSAERWEIRGLPVLRGFSLELASTSVSVFQVWLDQDGLSIPLSLAKL